MTTKREVFQPGEEFWAAVAAHDGTLTPAKLAAFESGAAYPIEQYDYIQWEHSYRVGGYVIDSGSLLFGKTEMPAWVVWNELLQKVDYIPKDGALLMGWAR